MTTNNPTVPHERFPTAPSGNELASALDVVLEAQGDGRPLIKVLDPNADLLVPVELRWDEAVDCFILICEWDEP